MPKKVIVVAGIKVFSFDMGMPRSRHIARNEDISCLQCDVDLAKIMKSSSKCTMWAMLSRFLAITSRAELKVSKILQLDFSTIGRQVS